MKIFLLVICLLPCIFTLRGPKPPIWPATFSQDFVLNQPKSKIYETGKLWFDAANSRIRFDFSGSNYQSICSKVSQDNTTKCSLINDKGALYINLPQKSKCCTCYTKTDNITLIERDWLKDFIYAGEATLSGQTFYKWNSNYSSKQPDSYYATEDVESVPRRIQIDLTWDFIMNTYSKEKINDSVFQVPSYCSTSCPKDSGCRQSTEQPKFANLNQVLLGRRSDKVLTE